MKQQGFRNHTRYYTPHHFVFYPLLILMLILIAIANRDVPEYKLVWLMMGAIILLIGWLSFMMRQHYALTLQNRVVVLELRLRYYQLTQRSFDAIEMQLSFGQIAALRFASDEELLNLIDKTLSEKLTAAAIKEQIKKWKPDHMRV